MKFFVVLAAVCLTVNADYTAPIVKPEDCVQYVPGNFNMIITAPHGGATGVPGCNLRTPGCYINGACSWDNTASCTQDANKCPFSYLPDTYTPDIATMVVQNVATNLKGKTPHLVIMRCTRYTLDVNREVHEAAQGCANGVTAYNLYHNTIRSIYSTFTQGKALLFDIHGQAHKQNATELGYGVDKSVWDAVVASPTHAFPNGALNSCTINALRSRLAAKGLATDYDLLIGKKSMGALLQNEGFAAIPSPTLPPVPGFPNYQYFDGGFTVQNHSSATLDAIQMEGPGEVRIDGGLPMRTAYAQALANAITNFYNAYYA